MVLASAGDTSCPRIEIWFGLLVAIEGVPGDAMTGYCDSGCHVVEEDASLSVPQKQCGLVLRLSAVDQAASMAWLI